VRPFTNLFYTGITIISIPVGLIIIAIVAGLHKPIVPLPKEKVIIPAVLSQPLPKIIHDTIRLEAPVIKPKRKKTSVDSLITHRDTVHRISDTLK